MTEQTSHLKVLHIASGDLWAGAEVQLFTLSKELHSMPGITVEVILLNHGKLEQELRNIGINVTVFDETQFNGIKILFCLINAIRKISPDVIHTHRIKENILGSIAAYLAGNIPSLRTAHGAPEHKPARYNIPKQLIFLLDKYCGRLLQKRIIAVSDDLAGILQRNFPANRIKVIENGIDAVSLSGSIEPGNSSIGTSDTPLRIGIAGRLTPVKRVDLFIKAALQLLDSHPELKLSFHIFGDGPLRSDLEALCKETRLKDKIHFEGHCEDMKNKLADLDILLSTSDHEGLPMILLEAMSAKIPIIAHAVGGIPKLLDQGACGILVSDHSSSAYADAIYNLATAPEKMNVLISNAYKRVTSAYSSKHNAGKYLEAYKSLSTRRRVM